jgi:hypothetical protein
MGGRFFLGLAYFAFAGMILSTALAAAVMLKGIEFNPLYQFGAFLVPLALIMLALRPRDEDERILSGAAIGLHPSNRRRALKTCFAPYRPRRFAGWFRTSFRRRVSALQLVFAVLLLGAKLIIPYAFFMAFLMALRRAAWFGNLDAIILEWDWLRLRGPISSREGRELAAQLADAHV